MARPGFSQFVAPKIDRREWIEEIDAELFRPRRHQVEFASLHECYALILEELDELWAHTKLKLKDRDADEIRKELVQIAAMAIKGVRSLHNFTGGSV